jgi:hypothetical protein
VKKIKSFKAAKLNKRKIINEINGFPNRLGGMENSTQILEYTALA